tara:strand:+ start:938 stop:1330 length:393 start_codon:yes stop_codon:yes gene_type:complete
MSSKNKDKNNKEEIVDDEEGDGMIRCFNCKCEIHEKPWITVNYPVSDIQYHACKYLCARNLRYEVGDGYWVNVTNKEDFPGPRPISRFTGKKDITSNFGIDDIRNEIELEQVRMEMMEEYSSEDEDLLSP